VAAQRSSCTICKKKDRSMTMRPPGKKMVDAGRPNAQN